MQSKESQNDKKNQTKTEEEKVMTRKEQRKAKKKERKKNRRPIRRIFPIWLRIIVVLIGSAVAIIGGVMVGYGILGEGTPADALKKETWEHIIDIVRKRE